MVFFLFFFYFATWDRHSQSARSGCDGSTVMLFFEGRKVESLCLLLLMVSVGEKADVYSKRGRGAAAETQCFIHGLTAVISLCKDIFQKCQIYISLWQKKKKEGKKTKHIY